MQLADWGIELAFFRTKVGREFDVIRRIDPRAQDSTIFFGTYGYFDLVAIRCLKKLAVESLVPLDGDVLESAPFRFFADSANETTEGFIKIVSNWKTAIAVFLKINPVYFQKAPSQVRFEMAQYLRKQLSEARVFFGLGYSEILVLTGGENLPRLLETITRLRNLTDQAALKGMASDREPLFVRTTTFPLVSYDQIHSRGKYQDLEGNIHPVVTVSCDPRAESQILADLPDEMLARDSYVDTDLVLYWKSKAGIPFGEFAKFLTEFRGKWSGTSLVVKTTSYLETSRSLSGKSSEIKPEEFPPVKSFADVELFKTLRNIHPEALRASVADLVLRLSACLSDKNLEADYRDMARTFDFIRTAGKEISENNPDHLEAMKARFTLTEVADLARSAINQRYSGLEIHPETLAHSQSPILCDIRSIVLASSCLPAFVFEHLKSNGQREALWAGYVLFGNAYTPKWYPQNILALPATSIYRPIEEWWKITHEIAHAVFDLLRVKNKISPAFREFIILAYGKDNAIRVLNEFFANWFDWKYIFQKDTAFFIKSIWQSWGRLPIVWEQKHQYLVRSFAVMLCESLPDLVKRWQSGREVEHIMPLLQEKWLEFVKLLRTGSDMDRFLNDVTEKNVRDIFVHVSRSAIPMLSFFENLFEKSCGIEELFERLNPPYPDVMVHVSKLLRGEVVTDPIPNPCKLHLELRKKLNGSPTLCTEIAYILSLENLYVTTVSPLNEA